MDMPLAWTSPGAVVSVDVTGGMAWPSETRPSSPPRLRPGLPGAAGKAAQEPPELWRALQEFGEQATKAGPLLGDLAAITGSDRVWRIPALGTRDASGDAGIGARGDGLASAL